MSILNPLEFIANCPVSDIREMVADIKQDMQSVKEEGVEGMTEFADFVLNVVANLDKELGSATTLTGLSKDKQARIIADTFLLSELTNSAGDFDDEDMDFEDDEDFEDEEEEDDHK